MDSKNNVIIFGVKTGDTYHYIGKTKKINSQGGVNNSYVHRQYTNSNIRNIFVENNDVTVEKLEVTSFENWYDEKLHRVVEKYQNNHPLLNAQWMVEGKRGVWEGTRGYWYGKKRDENTLRKLSKSKFKKVVEYNSKGYLKKIWSSKKEVGINIFKDYRIINGGGKSKIYKILDSSKIINHFSHGSYWFNYDEIYNKYNEIPNYINIIKLKNEEKKIRSEIMKKAQKNKKMIKQYNIIHYKPNGTIIIYKNVKEAAYILKTSVKTIQRICKGQIIPNKNYKLKYGEKNSQPHSVKYPDYIPISITKIKKKTNNNIKLSTRTSYSIERIKNGNIIDIFFDVKHASQKLKLHESIIRRICKFNKIKKYPNIELRYGKKIKSFKIKKLEL